MYTYIYVYMYAICILCHISYISYIMYDKHRLTDVENKPVVTSGERKYGRGKRQVENKRIGLLWSTHSSILAWRIPRTV